MVLEHEHQWEAWQTAADQFGLISPDKDGTFWRYERHCAIMFCNEIEYAEFLVPKGKTKSVCNGIRTD